MAENIYKYVVDEQDLGKRIDVLITEKNQDLSRAQVQKLIENENILVSDKKIKSNYKVRNNDVIMISIPEPVRLEVEAEDIDIDIIYEDEYLAVVNKPQGMVVHPAAGNYTGTLVNALLARCENLSTINGVIRPGIVHRIDKDTSGILVIAKNDLAHRSLSEQIKEHSVKRVYVAIVEGVLKTESGTIDKPIARHPQERKKMAIVERGRRAVTHFKVLETFKSNSLIEARLETGRTHQIRVHMASLGHPLVGDPVYGYKKQKFKTLGQALHAKTLGFIHPKTGEYMEFNVEPPNEFNSILLKLRNENI